MLREKIASEEEMKQEAVKRIKYLGINKPMIDAFKKKEKIAISETADHMQMFCEEHGLI